MQWRLIRHCANIDLLTERKTMREYDEPMGETYEAPRPSDEAYKKYHQSKKQLIDLLKLHEKNLHEVNPKPTMNDGSYEMGLEYAGFWDIKKLLDRLEVK